MKLRYAFLALLLAPGVAFAQLSNPDSTLVPGSNPPEYFPADSPFYDQLNITAPASLVAEISNFRTELLPVPPYTLPPATSLFVGHSAFSYVAPDGTEVPMGVDATPAGVSGDLVFALRADGTLAFGCDGTAELTNDIANAADLAGNIALVQRGPVGTGLTACGFFLKAQRAEQAGAVGFIVYNDPARSPDNAPNMSGGVEGDTPVGIPAISLPWTIAETLFNEFAGGGVVSGTIRCDEAYGDNCSFGVAGEGRPSADGAGLFLAGQNPTSTTARLVVRTPGAENVSVIAYNMLGQQVAVLHNGPVVGEQFVTLQGTSLPSGSYFVRATGETFQQTQQITVVR